MRNTTDRLIQMTRPRHALCLVLFSVKMNGDDDKDDGDDDDDDEDDGGLEISLCGEGEI